MRAAIYLRLSKEDKRESIENQRQLLRQYSRNHDFEIVREYKDEAMSGLSDERPGFLQMMEDAKRGVFDVILAKNQSRFSRNFLHIEQYLHQELPKLQIRFIGVTDGVDTGPIMGIGSGKRQAEKSGKKSRQIYALINEWYCQEISENVRTILHQKVRQGEFIGSYAPFGYQKSKENSHQLVPVEPEASIVKELFEKYSAGFSVNELVQLCKERSYPAPNEKTGWKAGSIYKILSNECYIGNLVQGKSKTANYKNSTRIQIPREDWVRVTNTHQPIVSKELFEQVQKKKKRGNGGSS